jgi:hypothetical protein
MLADLLVPLAAAASLAFATDTTLTATRTSRLELSSFAGDVEIRTWDRSAVRVMAEHDRRSYVTIERRGNVLWIESESRRFPPTIEYRLTVPAWLPVHVDGVNVSVKAQGLQGGVTVSTVNGEIRMEDGEGPYTLESVQGEIVARALRGRVLANAVNGLIDLDGVSGVIVAETVNGEILLRRVVSDSVDVSSVNGALCFDGALRPLGVYRLASHNGDIAVGLADGAATIVTVSTYEGNFHSDFPVDGKQKSRGKQFVFQLGRGGSTLDLESFQGRIWLRRPGSLWKKGEPPCAEDEEHDHSEEEEDEDTPAPRSPR